MPNNQESNMREQREEDVSTSYEATATQGGDAPGENLPSGNEASQFYGALKGYFYTPKRGDIWGAFCLLFDGATGATIENVFWVTRQLIGPPIDV
ncbi:MAG: hypothetical protein LBO68_04110, partial [Synergistaceae bacterium]|nr:hypothetical protein [Synergistaceae bacterium]